MTHKCQQSSSLPAVSLESEFQSLMVRGNLKGTAASILHYVVMRLSLLTVGTALGGGGGDYNLVLMMGHWTSPLYILYITPRRAVFLRCSRDGHPSESE